MRQQPSTVLDFSAGVKVKLRERSTAVIDLRSDLSANIDISNQAVRRRRVRITDIKISSEAGAQPIVGYVGVDEFDISDRRSAQLIIGSVNEISGSECG